MQMVLNHLWAVVISSLLNIKSWFVYVSLEFVQENYSWNGEPANL